MKRRKVTTDGAAQAVAESDHEKSSLNRLSAATKFSKNPQTSSSIKEDISRSSSSTLSDVEEQKFQTVKVKTKTDLDAKSHGFKLSWGKYPRNETNNPVPRPGSFTIIAKMDTFQEAEAVRKALLEILNEVQPIAGFEEGEDGTYGRFSSYAYLKGLVKMEDENGDQQLIARLVKDELYAERGLHGHILVAYVSSEALKARVKEVLTKKNVLSEEIPHVMRAWKNAGFTVHALHGCNQHERNEHDFVHPVTQYWMTKAESEEVVARCLVHFQNFESVQIGPCFHLIEVRSDLRMQGIGRRMVRSVFYDWLSQLPGIYQSLAFFTVTAVEPDTVGFWRRLGFVEFGIWDEYCISFEWSSMKHALLLFLSSHQVVPEVLRG